MRLKEPGARRCEPARRPAPRAKLRCPACGETVTMPATNCAGCGVDLRTGYLKKRRPRRRLRDWALAAVWIVGLAGSAWFLSASWRTVRQPPAAAPVVASTPEERRTAIEAAPASFQRLAEENPLLLLPYIYVYRAKTSAARYQRQFADRYDQLDMIDDLKELQLYQKASPAQRQRMLKDILEQTPAAP